MMKTVSRWWLLILVTKFLAYSNANWITGNLCWSMPCMNGGSCFGAADTYLCICPVDYGGSLCEERLGVCHENPCGNRGSCVERSSTSFECRCYSEYSGLRCEEHRPKPQSKMWSSLSPTHTRVLFDMLQEAYYKKGKALITSNNGQIDFMGLLASEQPISTTSIPGIRSSFILRPTAREYIIPAQDIQLEEIFPDVTTMSSFDDDEDNTTTILPPILEMDITFSENISTTEIDSLNTTIDQESVNVTEHLEPMTTSIPKQWSTIEAENSTDTSGRLSDSPDDDLHSSQPSTTSRITTSESISTSTMKTSTTASLFINKLFSPSVRLHRIDMDEILHQLSNNIIESEH